MPDLEPDDLEARLKALRTNLDNPPSSERRVDPLKVVRMVPFKTTAGALLAAALSNPDHPAALAFRKGCRGMADNKEVTVHRVDVEALLDDKDVAVVEEPEEDEDEEGQITRIVVTKKLGGKRKPMAKAEKRETVVESQQIMTAAEVSRHQRETVTTSPNAQGPTDLENAPLDVARNAGNPSKVPAPVTSKRPAETKGPSQDPENFHQPNPQSRGNVAGPNS